LFVFRTDKTTTEANIKVFVQDNGYIVRNVTTLSHKDATFKSFKLTVPLSQVSELLNPELWPEGIGIRPFRREKRSNDKAQPIEPMA
jgi:hypothetical protein